MLVPLPGAAWLLVGEHGGFRQGTSEWSIRNLQRKYPVIKFTRSGSPLVGKIVFTLREADAEAERRCFGRLRGIAVRWLNRAGDPDVVEHAGKMVVREVRFQRAAVIGLAEILCQQETQSSSCRWLKAGSRWYIARCGGSYGE